MTSKKQNEIIDSSIRLFTQYGYNGPSIDKICEEAGVSKMTFYRYFKDKNALIESVLNQKRTQFIEAIMKIEQSESGVKNKLFTIFQYYDEWFKTDTFNGCLFSRALFEAGNTNMDIKKLNSQFRAEMFTLLRKILSETLKPEAAERTSLMILMLIDGAIIAQGSTKDTSANKEYPPALVAWQAAKTLIYAEGGQLD